MFPSVYQHRLAAWFQLTLPSPGIWVRDHTSLGLDLIIHKVLITKRMSLVG